MDATFPAVPGVLGTCRWGNLPSGQRHVDHIGGGSALDHPDAAVEKVHARCGHDTLIKIRAAAIVPDVIEAQVELRNPEHLGPCELCLATHTLA